MGCGYVKLMQFLVSHGHGLPPAWRHACHFVLEQAKPKPWAEVERVLGETIDLRRFEDVATEPLAAASVGQVHRARLRTPSTAFDGSEFSEAVVKVLYRDRAEGLPVGPDFATYFKKTTHAIQRCKHEQERRSYGRDRVDAAGTETRSTSSRST